jgi:hypothetical protein
MSPADTWTTRSVERLEELDDWRGFWTEVQWHPNADIDFFSMIAASRAQSAGPCVLVASEDGIPRALLAGRIEATECPLKIGYKRVMGIKARALVFVVGGYMGPNSDAIAAVFLRGIRGLLKERSLDFAVLNHFRQDLAIVRLARRMPGFFTRDHFPETHVHWAMAIPGSLSDFMSRRKQKHRYWLNRLVRVLERDFRGRFCVQKFMHENEVGRLCEAMEQVAKMTYQRQLGVGFLNDEEHRARFMFNASRGRLRGYVLYLDGVPKAFWAGTLYRRVFHSGWTGYDPSLRKYELGTVLFVKMVEDLCGDDVDELDFGLGTASYKERFGDISWLEESVFIYSPTVRGVALNSLKTLVGCMVRPAEFTLKRLKLIGKVKTRWRRALTADAPAKTPA